MEFDFYKSYIENLMDDIAYNFEGWVDNYREDMSEDEYDDDDYADSLISSDMEDFASYMDGCPFTEERGGHFAGGAFKMCYLPEDEPFVVKFYYEVTECNEEEVYQNAKEVGLQDFFYKVLTPVYDFQLPGGVILHAYCQEKAKPTNADVNSKDYYTSSRSECTDSKLSSHWGGCYKEFIFALIDTIGEEESEQLMDFFDEMGLGDFHTENWTIENGRVKIFDYSSIN